MGRKKESVYLRTKELSNGNKSLYLDIYHDGKRTYEFLKMYLVPETTRKNKITNKETLRLAENERILRIAQLQKGDLVCIGKEKTRLIDFINAQISQKSPGTAEAYVNMLPIVIDYFGKDYILEDITNEEVKKFFKFIENRPNQNKPDRILSPTTQNHYCTIFKSFLNKAIEDRLISMDVIIGLKLVKKSESAREYLSIEELQKLVDTKPKKTYRRAFLFSCLTGLRRSDVEKLVWGDVMEQDGFTRIVFRQKKTRSIEYLDISPQARELMGERKSPSENVFYRFHCRYKTNRSIKKWVKSVGIDKDITFHCARHTFAVMMLTIDVDLYTTSKLLGHKKVETTQIYAKIIDKKKQEAVTKIPIVI